MTRKDFEAVASIIAEHNISRAAVQDFMNLFIADNPRFDEDRFMKALRSNGWDNWQGLV